jgi:regulator of sirC expression with transglutaminase-like and TPR domain
LNGKREGRTLGMVDQRDNPMTRAPSLFAVALAAALLTAPAASAKETRAKPTAIHDYDSCMKLVKERPEDALEAALAWEHAGGGNSARHCAAMALANMGNFTAAADQLESLAWDLPEATPDSTRAQVLAQAGELWLDAQQPTKANALLSAAIELEPRDSEMRIDRAMAYAAAGRYQDAIMDLSASILLNPKSTEAFVLRASAFRHTGQPAEAAQDLKRALKMTPNHPGALLERGLLRKQAGDEKGARADWQTLLKYHPDSVAAEAARRYLGEPPKTSTKR